MTRSGRLVGVVAFTVTVSLTGAAGAVPAAGVAVTSTPAPAGAVAATVDAAVDVTGPGKVLPVAPPVSWGTEYGKPGRLWTWKGYHTGVDFPAEVGREIAAAAEGVVTVAGWGGAYGNHVQIAHPDGVTTLYAHMSTILTSVDTAVTAGQTIGLVGSTGNSTGPHLHFETRTGDGEPFDPTGWLAGAATVTVDPAAVAQVAALQAKADRLRADLDAAEDDLAAARTRYDAAHAHAADLRGQVAAAQTLADAAHSDVDRYARAAYMNGPTDLAGMGSVLDAKTPTEFLDRHDTLRKVGDHQAWLLAQALAELARVDALRAEADRVEADAAAARDAAHAHVNAVRARVAAAAADLAAQMSVVNARYTVESAQQVARNQEVARGWASYVKSLAKAKVPPLTADLAAHPGRLPAPFTPVRRPDGTFEPGVARVAGPDGPITVLPGEVIRAVTFAVGQLGAAYLVDGSGPDGWSCAPLTAAAWAAGGVTLPGPVDAQATVARRVTGTVRPGDLVHVGDPQLGVHHVGIAVTGTLMIAASAATNTVTVHDIPTGVYAVSRPSLGLLPKQDRRVTIPDTGQYRCDAPKPVFGGAGSAAWGGWSNGLIPDAALQALDDHPQHRLRPDAAAAFDAMSAAFRREFGTPLCITDSYRGLDVQARLYAIGQSHAVPGTSNHGWGLAVDFCVYREGQVHGMGFDSPEYAWLAANEERFGWRHPAWARQGPLAEPWHHQYLIDDSRTG